MKIDNISRKEIVESLLQSLENRTEPAFAVNFGTRTKKIVQVPINHKRRINKIISGAKDMEDMTTQLGKYLSKYGTPTATVEEKK